MIDTEQINKRLNTLRDKAVAARRTYTAARENVDAQKDRTAGWKKEQISDARTKLARTLSEIKTEEETFLDTKIKEIERGIFGIKPGQSVIEYRDALDRVNNIKWEDERSALRLHEQAIRSGDDTLIQALTARAVTAGWDDVLSNITNDKPEHEAGVEALRNIAHFQKWDMQSEYQMPID